LSNKCPICKKEHPPKLHCFADRTYKKGRKNDGEDDVVETRVPRFFCKPNYLRQQETGEKIPYTVTILPGFLIPHSIIPVDPVHTAINIYITGSWLKQVGAAQRMNCRNPISFRLFFSRVRKRLEDWIALLLQLLVTLEGQVKEARATEPREPQNLKAQWAWFVWLTSECVRLYARIPDAQVVPQRFLWQYIYCLLSRHRMGLGP
jgi:hypothetical protein